MLDITVEDPSDNFVCLRDYVDCKNCRQLSEFSKENLGKGWNDILAEAARSKLKLNKKQTRRVYEILKLATIDRSNEDEYRAYRLEVKGRLNAPFAKLNRSAEKSLDSNVNTKEMRIEELKGTLCSIDLRFLHSLMFAVRLGAGMYQEVEEEYLAVIEKLATV